MNSTTNSTNATTTSASNFTTPITSTTSTTSITSITSTTYMTTLNSSSSNVINSSLSLLSSDWSIDNWTTSSSSSSPSSSSSSFYDASCYQTESEDPRIIRSAEVFIFFSLVFVVVGLTGNLLSIVVFSSKEMQSMSSNVYLLMLASSDSLYLLSTCLNRTLTAIRCWYFPSASFDIVNRSSFACILLQYLADLFSDYSTCLILLFTMERGVAVFLPIKFKELFSVSRARLSCLVLFLFIAAAIAPNHVLYIDLFHEYHVCGVVESPKDIFTILYIVEVSLLRVLPVLLIALINVLIIVRVTRLTRAKARRRQLLISSCEARGGGGQGGAGQGLTSSASASVPINAVASISKASAAVRRRSKAQERNFQLTLILILVSTSYVLLYIPVLIHFVLYALSQSKDSALDHSSLAIFGNYSRTLYVSGFAINFFLYTVSGRVFRDQLLAIVCPSMKRQKRRATPWTQTTTAPPEASSAL